nr:condensation domain-containing protein [uncultured bacterium]
MTAQLYGLAPPQRRLWHEYGRALLDLNTEMTVEVEGADEDRLRDAVQWVTGRHEVFRTSLTFLPGVSLPLQCVAAESSVRADVTCVEVGVHRLTIAAPAVLVDATSARLLFAEIVAAYDGGDCAQPLLQFLDVAEWLEEMAASTDADSGRAFWERNGWAPPPVASDSGAATQYAELHRSVPGARPLVESRAAGYDVPADLLVLAVWQLVVGAHLGRDGVTVGRVFDGRHLPELRDVLGRLDQLLPLPGVPRQGVPTGAVVAAVAAAVAEAAEWQDCYPGDAAAGVAAAGELDWSGRFGYGGLWSPVERPARGATFRLTAIRSHDGPCGLLLTGEWSADDLSLRLRYATSAADEQQAQRLLERLATALVGWPGDTNASVGNVPMIGPGELAAIRAVLAGRPAAVAPFQPVHRRFEAETRRNPRAVALRSRHGDVTFGALNRQANALAGKLLEAGTGPETVVALAVGRSAELILGLLAVLKAGAAFLPLDPAAPARRIQEQLTSAGVTLALAESGHERRLPAAVAVQPLQVDWYGCSPDAPDPHVPLQPRNLAYVLFTSGSTGTPNPVAVEHEQLAAYVTSVVDRLGLAGLTAATTAAPSSDLGYTAVFPPLCSGGTVAVLGAEALFDPAVFAVEVAALGVDVLKITPSHLQALLDGPDAARVLPRRLVVVGGERCPAELPARLALLAPHLRVVNHYGPTETTVGALTWADGDAASAGEIPIGLPLPHVVAGIIDDEVGIGRPAPWGGPGRLVLGGSGVARGYLGRPRLTATRFLPDPSSRLPGARVYDTGDRARLSVEGQVVFLGRTDDQVKVRGVRIEPGEVESALEQHPAVRRAVVMAAGDGAAASLVAHVVAVPGESLDPAELRDFLLDRLPEAMVPSVFNPVEQLPLLPSGKVDRQALPTLTGRCGTGESVPPETPMEQILAAMWEDVFGVAAVGIDDDFFRLGGHSLSATRIMSRIREVFGRTVDFPTFFARPTVRSLAAALVDGEEGPAVERTAELVLAVMTMDDDEVARWIEAPSSEGSPPWLSPRR